MICAVVILSAIVVALLFILYTEIKKRNKLLNEWEKWENEYWLLRSYASKHLNIHISWLPRGVDNCIKEKSGEL